MHPRILLLCAVVLTCFAAFPTRAAAQPATGSGPEAPAASFAAALSFGPSAKLVPVLLQPARQTLRSVVAGLYTATTSRFTVLSTGQNMAESLDALPVIGTLRRRAGRRFNTDDASIDDFAICYRLSSHMGFQFIPGDPAPVKLAVTSMRNDAGLTVGMTWKLFRR